MHVEGSPGLLAVSCAHYNSHQRVPRHAVPGAAEQHGEEQVLGGSEVNRPIVGGQCQGRTRDGAAIGKGAPGVNEPAQPVSELGSAPLIADDVVTESVGNGIEHGGRADREDR